MNELEERRIIRLLNELADEVEPLAPEEVEAVLQVAPVTRVVRRRRSRPQPRALVAAAAAAAVVLGTTVVSGLTGAQRPSQSPASTDAELVTFPEGSALRLLLSTRSS